MKSTKYLSALTIILSAVLLSGCGSSGQGNIAGSYLKACYDEDAKKMISLVPNAVIEDLMSEYKCSKEQLTEAVEAELSVESRDYWDCSEIKQAKKLEDIDENSYDDYFDRRVEIDLDKISGMTTYQVDVADNRYYKNLSVFHYGGKWYSTDAANFIAYAVWEKY